MPTIEKPVELAEALVALNMLKQELQAAQESLAAQSEQATENAATITTLTDENTQLKDALATKETEVGALTTAKEDAEVKATLATSDLSTAVESNAAFSLEITQLKADLATAQGQIEALTDKAADSEQKAEDLQEQNALVAEHLQVRSLPPDMETVGGTNVDPTKPNLSADATLWFALENSKDPEDKQKRRRIYNTNPAVKAEVDNEISRRNGRPAKAKTIVAGISDADLAVYTKWQEMEGQAALALAPFSGVPAVERHRRHSEAKVAARKYHKSNADAINRVISAGGSQAVGA